MRAEQVDLVVVGAGPAGLTAATVAAQDGARVLVLDEAPLPGGRLPLQLHERADGWRAGRGEAEALVRAADAAGVRIVLGASVWGLFPRWDLYVAAVDPAVRDGIPDRVSARAVLIATGAAQNPVAVPGWTLPGVLAAGAAQTLVNVQRIPPGRRAVVVGVDPLAVTVAHQVSLGGVEVRAVAPPAPGPFALGATSPAEAIRQLARLAAYAPGAGLRVAGQIVEGIGGAGLAAHLFPREGVSVWGIPLLLRRAVTAVLGRTAVTGVRIADLDAAGALIPGSEEEWPVDTVVTSAGLYPLAELAQLAGVPLVHVPELGGHVPVHGPDLETPVEGVFVAGSVTGVAGGPVATAQGRIAGLSVLRGLGRITPADAAARLEPARGALAEARQGALPLMPETERGLRRLGEAWAACTRESSGKEAS